MSESRSLFRTNVSRYYNEYDVQRLYNVSKGSTDFLQRLRVDRKLCVHNGCVNTVCWNETGQYILSGSDDQHLAITNPFTGKNVVTIHSGHRANIFAAKFLPCTQDRHIISCSGDGTIFFTEVDREDTYGQHKFDCHFGTTYEVLTVPHDPNTFLSCGEDGTVRWFDLRTKTSCTKEDCKDDVLLNCRRAVTALCVNPVIPYQLGVACSDSSVRIFDRRMLGTRATGNYSTKSTTGLVARFTAPLLENRAHRVTSLQYSPDGEELLVSYSSELIYLFNMKEDGKTHVELQKDSTPPDSQVKGDISQEPQPSTSSADSGEGNRQPPVKRLRLRGDWSDTGPNARPESERGQEASRSVTIMQRMSDMLTRWLDGANRSSEQQEGEGNEDGERGAQEAIEGEQPVVAQGAESNSPNVPREERIDLVSDASGSERQENNSREQEKEKEGATHSSTEGKCAKPAEGNANTSETAGEKLDDCDTAISVENNGAKQEDETSVKTETVIDTQSQGEDKRIKDHVSGTSNNNDGAMKDTEQFVMHKYSQQPECKDDGSDLRQSNTPASSDVTSSGATTSTGISDVSVQSIRHTIQNTQVEPVISLQYHSEGTTASTIKVDFQAVETIPCIASTADVRPCSSSETNVSHVRKENSSAGDNVKNENPCQDEQSVESSDKESMKVRVAPAEDVQSHGQGKCQIPSVGESAEPAVCDEKLTPNLQSRRADDFSHNLNQSEPSTSVLKEARSSASEETVERVAEHTSPNFARDEAPDERSSDVEGHDSYDEFTDYDTANEDQNEAQKSDEGNVESDMKGKSEPEFEKTAPQVTITTAPDSSNDDEVEGSRPSTSQEGAGAEGSTSAQSLDGDSISSSRLVTRSRGVTGVSSSGRQRRIGHSGPPTGDFQLHSASDDDDDDSDSELMRAAERSRRSRDNMERNIAALRLQELYRKRQEEREKEEREMMNLKQPVVKQVFRGHRNARTMIKEANFWGEHHVMSGSDCGHIFIWDRYTGKLVMLLEGDRHVVNCVQPHPYYPVLASSGIDYDVKIWMPISEEICFDSEKANEVMRRNEIMLEETRDTITVPASFMLRMLASLNNIRAGRRANQQEEEDSSSSSEDDETIANNLFNDDNNNDSNNNV